MEGERRVSGGIWISLFTSILRSVKKKTKQSCYQKSQSSFLSMLLLKACMTFISADNELVIISMEGPDSFYAPHHQPPCLIQSVFM